MRLSQGISVRHITTIQLQSRDPKVDGTILVKPIAYQVLWSAIARRIFRLYAKPRQKRYTIQRKSLLLMESYWKLKMTWEKSCWLLCETQSSCNQHPWMMGKRWKLYV